MRPPRIQICNERFLSRFGLDRQLLLAANYFRGKGADVTLAALWHDPAITEPTRLPVLQIPVPPGLDMQATERFATAFMLNHWLADKPDVLVIGGFPFFDLASKASSFDVKSCYQDVGAVPHDGFPDSNLTIQQELRRIRSLTIPFIDSVLPNSDFTRISQSEPDRGNDRAVRTVRLGADHLTNLAVPPRQQPEPIVAQVDDLARKGCKLVLNLGRFEDFGYKNSPACFEVIRALRRSDEDLRLLILADEKNLAIPDDLTDVVLPLGTPSDHGLLAIMQAVDLGLSMSFWEGFNLPLVEMQHVGRPVLAFTTGANPEVIADPWFMCRDQAQMVEKGNCLLGWGELPPSRSLRALLEYKKRFPWSDTLEAWWQEVKKLACSIPATPRNEIGRRTVFIDVTNSARDEANSGVIRVTRQLTRRLQTHAGLDVICVGWNREGYFAELVDPRHSHLGDFGGPLDPHGRMVDPAESRAGLERLVYAADPRMPIAPVLFFPEVALDGTLSHRIKWAHDRGIMTSAVLHDLVPHYYPQYCSQEVISGFKPYIKAMTSVGQILANSTATLTDFNRYSQETRAPMPPSTQAIWLPAQFANVNRVTHFEMPSSSVIRILCVSTIEPRKNHMRLIDAYRELVRRRPDLRFRLVLVGNRYAGAEELANRILSAAGEGIGIEWQNVLTDEALLVQLAAARFTVYPSVVEGFGMPIAESLWLGKPVVCANSGAMYELARAGGCLTVDVTDIEALSAALERLSTDNEMHRRLSTEALSRTLLDWNEYATCIGDELFGLMNPYPPSPMRNQVKDTEGAVMPGLELAHPLGRFLSLISRASTSGASSGPSDPIRKLYAELLGREVDAIGLNYWRDVAARSGDFEAVRAGIMASEEYRRKKNSSARSEVAG